MPSLITSFSSKSRAISQFGVMAVVALLMTGCGYYGNTRSLWTGRTLKAEDTTATWKGECEELTPTQSGSLAIRYRWPTEPDAVVDARDWFVPPPTAGWMVLDAVQPQVEPTAPQTVDFPQPLRWSSHRTDFKVDTKAKSVRVITDDDVEYTAKLIIIPGGNEVKFDASGATLTRGSSSYSPDSFTFDLAKNRIFIVDDRRSRSEANLDNALATTIRGLTTLVPDKPKPVISKLIPAQEAKQWSDKGPEYAVIGIAVSQTSITLAGKNGEKREIPVVAKFTSESPKDLGLPLAESISITAVVSSHKERVERFQFHPVMGSYVAAIIITPVGVVFDTIGAIGVALGGKGADPYHDME